MSEDKTHEDGEQLFDTDQNDAATDAANDTKEDEEASEGEQEQDALDLEEKKDKGTSSKAEENKQKQLNAWLNKINSGKKSLDDLPVNLEWMRDDLEKGLEVHEDLKEKARQAVEDVDVKALVRKEIQEGKDLARFESLQEELESVLTADQKRSVSSAFKRLREKGLSKLDSIELAMEMSSVDLEQMGIDVKRSRMQIPSPSRGKKGDYSKEELKEMPYAEIVKAIPDRKKRMEFLASVNVEMGADL